MLLIGDIGGTKTNLAIISPDMGPRRPLLEATFPSASYPSLEAVANEFLARVDWPVERACFGVAGPVVGGQASVTNVPWQMEVTQLAQALGLSSVSLINDLESIATAIPFLEAVDLHTLNVGTPVARGAMAAVAPGTGLGEAYLTWDGSRSRYVAYPSEGGHASFSPSNALEMGLLSFLQERYGHVSCERVCSGIGLRNIYLYLNESHYAEEPDWLTERLAQTDDPNPVVVSAALDTSLPCPICVTALDTFVSILGGEAGNTALKVLSTGGVYLAGGIPRRILPALDKGFMAAFRNKGRFANLMGSMPVHVVINPKVALLGAACYGLGL
jgi:glucokinase